MVGQSVSHHWVTKTVLKARLGWRDCNQDRLRGQLWGRWEKMPLQLSFLMKKRPLVLLVSNLCLPIFFPVPLPAHSHQHPCKRQGFLSFKMPLCWSLLARKMSTELQWPGSCNLRPEGVSFLYLSLKLFFLPFIALPHGFACWNSHHSRLSSDATMGVSLIIPVGILLPVPTAHCLPHWTPDVPGGLVLGGLE